MRTFASSSVSKCQPLSNSSRSRPLKDSTHAFCQGDPGSMNIDLVPENRHQSAIAPAMNSGPLSKRTNLGTPRWVPKQSSVATTRSASMERSTTMARASRVYSSTMLSSLMVRPSTVVSYWKSSAHTTSGAIGDRAPIAVPMPRKGFLRVRYGTRSPSSRHRRWMRLSLTVCPSRRACFAARRQPQRGRARAKLRRNARRACSSSDGRLATKRWVDLFWPASRHARRSETPNRCRSAHAALRRRPGVRSFPA